jgi:predicted HicB family RNase H-like nuclease
MASRGRPKKEPHERRSRALIVLVNERERARIQKRARAAGMSVAAWLRWRGEG